MKTQAGKKVILSTFFYENAFPEFSFFGHDTAFELSLGAPLAVPTEEGQGAEAVFKEGWDEAADYTKLIRHVRFGQKEANN